MFVCVCLYFLYFFRQCAVVDGLPRSKRGIKAPQGKCLSFRIEKESNEQSIEYVCCNNCNATDGHCLGVTYEIGGTGDYCSRCGESNSSLARAISQQFSCGNCDVQMQKNRTCHSWNVTIPDACWLFRACFEHQCHETRNSTCFDGICDSHEDVESCPADCCKEKNPGNCTLVDGKCPLKCCGVSSCCENQNGDHVEGSSDSLEKFLTILQYVCVVIGIILVGFVVEFCRRKCDCFDENQIEPDKNVIEPNVQVVGQDNNIDKSEEEVVEPTEHGVKPDNNIQETCT